MIRCSDCAGFIQDKIGDGYGIGRCKAYGQYKRAGESPAQLKVRLIELGNRHDSTVFWGGALKDRNCNRYKAKV
jgi:hypothetical protein